MPASRGKPRAERIREFFSGLDEMREYLERHNQQPNRRRARLERIVHELMRPRSASELGLWLTRQLRDAFGASACTLLLADLDWQVWHASGESLRRPPVDLIESIESGHTAQTLGLPAEDDLAVALPGLTSLIGVLWLEGVEAVDARTAILLRALAETAGVMLEQGLAVESLIRDPATGLLAEGEFISRVSGLLKKGPAKGAAHAVVAFRVVGVETIKEAYGLNVADEALKQLARAVQSILPPEAALTRRFDDVLSVLPGVPAEQAELRVAAWVRAVNEKLQTDVDGSGAALSACASYLLAEGPVSDVMQTLEHIVRHGDDAPAGAAVRICS